MRIAIVAYSNIYRLPYISQYTDLLDDSAEVDIIFWNRDAKDESFKDFNLIPFDHPVGQNIVERLCGYFFFRRFIVNQLKKANYDLLIVTPMFVGLLLNSFLYKHYDKKYVLDIRDYSFERMPLVKLLERRLMKHCLVAVISSPGFKEFLPEYDDYIIVHNTRDLDIDEVERIRLRRKKRAPIKIAFIGFVGYHDQQKKMIDLFRNDKRFLLSFIGLNSDALRDYCDERQISNVEIRGAFEPSEILDFYKDVDVVNGIYGPNKPEYVYALSNKLYLAAALEMPMIVNIGTFTEEYTQGLGFVLGFDMEDSSSPDRLFDFYSNLNWERVHIGCKEFRSKVEEDNQRFKEEIGKLLNGKK